jgi:hypothetical protein
LHLQPAIIDGVKISTTIGGILPRNRSTNLMKSCNHQKSVSDTFYPPHDFETFSIDLQQIVP